MGITLFCGAQVRWWWRLHETEFSVSLILLLFSWAICWLSRDLIMYWRVLLNLIRSILGSLCTPKKIFSFGVHNQPCSYPTMRHPSSLQLIPLGQIHRVTEAGWPWRMCTSITKWKCSFFACTQCCRFSAVLRKASGTHRAWLFNQLARCALLNSSCMSWMCGELPGLGQPQLFIFSLLPPG